MKQQPCCLGVKVSVATARSLVLRIDSSPGRRVSKDSLCSQSYSHVLLTYLTYSSIIRGYVSTEHGQRCGRAQLQSFWEPQPRARCAVGFGLGAHRPVSTGQTGHVGAAWRAQCCQRAFCPVQPRHLPSHSPWSPGVVGDGFIRRRLMLRDFGGKGESQHYSYPSLPTLFLVNTWFLGKTSGTIFEMLLSFTFRYLRTQTAEGSNQHWNLAPVNYTSAPSAAASDINKAAQ